MKKKVYLFVQSNFDPKQDWLEDEFLKELLKTSSIEAKTLHIIDEEKIDEEKLKTIAKNGMFLKKAPAMVMADSLNELIFKLKCGFALLKKMGVEYMKTGTVYTEEFFDKDLDFLKEKLKDKNQEDNIKNDILEDKDIGFISLTPRCDDVVVNKIKVDDITSVKFFKNKHKQDESEPDMLTEVETKYNEYVVKNPIDDVMKAIKVVKEAKKNG